VLPAHFACALPLSGEERGEEEDEKKNQEEIK
jgi:hypothetical protein